MLQVYDEGNKGCIDQQELEDILHKVFGMEEVAVPTLFLQVDQDQKGKITFGKEEFMYCSRQNTSVMISIVSTSNYRVKIAISSFKWSS